MTENHENSKNQEDQQQMDEVFERLKQEIVQKRIERELHPKKSEKPNDYYCKLCGKKIKDYIKIRKCKNCKLPIGKDCQSCGFCLNCWTNMNENATKTLKLLRFLSKYSPFLLLFLLYQALAEIFTQNSFQSLILFFIALFSLVGFMTGFYFFSRWYIIKHRSRYFNEKWLKRIKKPNYEKILDPFTRNRYIPQDLIRDYEEDKKRSVQKLKEWIDPDHDYSDAPIPAYWNESHEERLKEKIEKVSSKARDSNDKSIQYNFVGETCPKCGTKIQFADFCAECNLKYCPKCSRENNPYNRICICGFVFPSLKEEYFNFVGNREIEVKTANKESKKHNNEKSMKKSEK